MNGFTIYDDTSTGGTLGLNGILQLNPENTFGELDTARPAFTFAPEAVDLSLDLDGLELSESLLNNIFGNNPYGNAGIPASTTTGAVNNLAAVWGDYLGGKKRTAQRQQFQGAALKTIASAVNVFDQLVTWGTRRENINLQKSNAKLAADNEMAAIDNQVLYLKNQLMDKFGELVAQNSVVMAAHGLKVSTGALLEASKETANDINMDFRTAESNAELQKISLRNAKKQAKIGAKMAKTSMFTDFINASIDLGLQIATGGSTGQTWGNLYSGYTQSFTY